MGIWGRITGGRGLWGRGGNNTKHRHKYSDLNVHKREIKKERRGKIIRRCREQEGKINIKYWDFDLLRTKFKNGPRGIFILGTPGSGKTYFTRKTLAYLIMEKGVHYDDIHVYKGTPDPEFSHVLKNQYYVMDDAAFLEHLEGLFDEMKDHAEKKDKLYVIILDDMSSHINRIRHHPLFHKLATESRHYNCWVLFTGHSFKVQDTMDRSCYGVFVLCEVPGEHDMKMVYSNTFRFSGTAKHIEKFSNLVRSFAFGDEDSHQQLIICPGATSEFYINEQDMDLPKQRKQTELLAPEELD